MSEAGEGFRNAKSFAGHYPWALDRNVLFRKRLRSNKTAGRAGEGHEFEPNAGLVGSLDAGRPSGHRDAILDL